MLQRHSLTHCLRFFHAIVWLGLSWPLFTHGAVAAAAAEADNPCNAPDPGFGIYAPWNPNLSLGNILIPRTIALTPKHEFDVIIHFHGGNAIRKELVKSARGVVMVGIDLGVGSGAYQGAFSLPENFLFLLATIEKAVAEQTGDPKATIRKLGLSAWSAGYGAIRAILRQDAGERVDSVVLIDGLHADYDSKDPSGMESDQLKPFLNFAQRAAKGGSFMFVSHSKIRPPGYASTTETAHYLVKRIGAKLSSSSGRDTQFLSRYEQAKAGNFLMRGYAGDGKSDHCAEIGVMSGVVSALEKRWKTPVAKQGTSIAAVDGGSEKAHVR